MKTQNAIFRLTILSLRSLLVAGLIFCGWLIYSKLPHHSVDSEAAASETSLQIALRPTEINAASLEIPIELYPVDVVAVRHEYFTERRAGKRFDDFLNERMQGRHPINATLDKNGEVTVAVPAGSWWLHAVLSGDEDVEWRVPVNVSGRKQLVELTSENVYTRTKSF
ncbi:MAG TPA: hypothetical protein VJT50_05445 [Pyrinomonadaceae bacterium]|nr:hypothetical protein [Pyrinomonadaceae bacterium]